MMAGKRRGLHRSSGASNLYQPPEGHLKKIAVVAILSALVMVVENAHAQQMDFAFGMGTVSAPSATVNSQGFLLPSIRGGAYPVFSGDLIFYKGQIGLNGEVAWRGSRSHYAGDPTQPYRPLFYDFNAIWTRKFGRIAPEAMAGIGAESIRIYQNFQICNGFSCTNYVSSNHFTGHFGGGIKLYPSGNFFIRPEVHLYTVRNNNEFSSGRVVRYGISIGYTLGGEPKY
jgi:hypothetical protein